MHGACRLWYWWDDDIKLSKREKKALIEVIDIFENIFMHFEDTDSLRYYLDDDDED